MDENVWDCSAYKFKIENQKQNLKLLKIMMVLF